MLDLIFSDKITVHWIIFSILNYLIIQAQFYGTFMNSILLIPDKSYGYTFQRIFVILAWTIVILNVFGSILLVIERVLLIGYQTFWYFMARK